MEDRAEAVEGLREPFARLARAARPAGTGRGPLPAALLGERRRRPGRRAGRAPRRRHRARVLRPRPASGRAGARPGRLPFTRVRVPGPAALCSAGAAVRRARAARQPPGAVAADAARRRDVGAGLGAARAARRAAAFGRAIDRDRDRGRPRARGERGGAVRVGGGAVLGPAVGTWPMRRLAPRRSASPLPRVVGDTRPLGLLAAVQSAWPPVAGPALAPPRPRSPSRPGSSPCACQSGAWAQELELLAPDLSGRLNEHLQASGEAGRVERLRFVVRSGAND